MKLRWLAGYGPAFVLGVTILAFWELSYAANSLRDGAGHGRGDGFWSAPRDNT